MTTLRITIPLIWRYTQEIRHKVAALLNDYPEHLRQGAVMVASELVENAVKYGEASKSSPEVVFSFSVEEQRLVIQVSSGAGDESQLRELKETIQRIREAPNREELYVDRLRQLIADSTQFGKLGLYRVGSEGHFDLSVEFKENLVIVTAIREHP